MELKEIIHQIHSMLEVKKKGTRIKQDEMAKDIGISQRAYGEYYRGTNQPLAMKVLLKMLNKLNNDEIIKVVRMAKDIEVEGRPREKKDKNKSKDKI